MNYKIFGLLGFFFLVQIAIAQAQTYKIKFSTTFGDFKVVLYDFTPNHRDLMLHAIENKVYHQALFNRVIEGFVVQGGEHDVDIATREADVLEKDRPRLAGEFDPRAFHKIGALGAGRDANLEKASFLNQLYFVVGKEEPISNAQLDSLEAKKVLPFTSEQRKEYTSRGGLPRLDQDYTIFGEVIEGLDILMKISKVKTNQQDYPLEKVVFSIQVL